MYGNGSQYPGVHNSRPPRDPNHRSSQRNSTRSPPNGSSSNSSNRSSADREIPVGVYSNTGRPARSSRLTSADSEPSVYDEIPTDKVPLPDPRQSKNNSFDDRPRRSVYRSQDPSPGSPTRNVPGRNPISMAPTGYKPRTASASMNNSRNSAAPGMIDLNLSRFSQTSNTSVNLGGVDYPIGTRLGSSGMFVIGDPDSYRKSEKISLSGSQPSGSGSTVPIQQGDGIAYDFEEWNWTVIRFVLFGLVCMTMIALLAAVIAVAIRHRHTCQTEFDWWKGATLYTIPVPYFSDSDNSKVGDLSGLIEKLPYLKYAGLGAVVLSQFTFSKEDRWDIPLSFVDIDPRLGNMADFQTLASKLHQQKINLMLQFCPWATGKDSLWYEESKGSSMASLNKYRDFYIWKNQPDTSIQGNWEYDNVRSQYYLHYADKDKPVLNWNDTNVWSAFNDIFLFWMQNGVDGFILCDADKFYTKNYTFIERLYSTVHGYSSGENGQKVLGIDGAVFNDLLRTNKSYYDYLLGKGSDKTRKIDLIQTKIYLNNTLKNRTTGIVTLIKNALQFQEALDGPWVNWKPINMSLIDSKYVGALQILSIVLPGTPSYVAGEEVGQFYMDNTAKYQTPMVWNKDLVHPINPGNVLSNNLYSMHNLSSTKKESPTLRLDRSEKQDDLQKDEKLNIKFLDVNSDENFVLFSRYLAEDKTYYYAGNFGDKALRRDLEFSIAPWATVIADSAGGYYGRLELRNIELKPGQAIIFYPTK